MKTTLFFLTAFVSAGQSTTSPWFVKNEVGRIGVSPLLRYEPAPWPGLSAYSRGRSITNGPTFYSRIVLDNANRTYFGYELLIEQQQPGVYLATFGNLGVTALDLAAGTLPKGASAQGWTPLPLPQVPAPRTIHDAETLSIEIFSDTSTGKKLFDDIGISPPGTHIPGVGPRPVPTAEGPARDFSAVDAEFLFLEPRVTLNRKAQVSTVAAIKSVRGPLVWLYLPGHGRYVLSLMPRPGLDFKKAGEVRGGVVTFTVNEDLIKLECTNRIAPGEAPYHLYVLHDNAWEPASERQKDQPGTGTVSAAELSALNQK
jgi:hypothetical protein